MNKPIRVVVADDSALMRLVIKDMLSSDAEIDVVGVAKDGLEVIELVKKLRPQVVTLDIKMSRLDGLGVLKRIRGENQTKVIILTGVSASELTYEALDLGAIDFILKPSGHFSPGLKQIQSELISKVKTAAKVSLGKFKPLCESKKEGAREVEKSLELSRIIAIGASTGGPPVLERVVSAIPSPFPACLAIVQHLPPGFSKSFAKRLDKFSNIKVKEAENNEILKPDTAYVAPGGYHLMIKKRKNSPIARLKFDEGAPVFSVKPAVDKLMHSVAHAFPQDAVGVLLSGMGKDGASGMKAIKERGGRTLVQDKKTSLVFGMAKAAVNEGCVDEVLPLERIAKRIAEIVKEK